MSAVKILTLYSSASSRACKGANQRTQAKQDKWYLNLCQSPPYHPPTICRPDRCYILAQRAPAASSSSRLLTSLETGTSKARMTAYLGHFFSFMTLARNTSRLCTGPMLMPDMGMLTSELDRKASSASRDPSVEDCAVDPAVS